MMNNAFQSVLLIHSEGMTDDVSFSRSSIPFGVATAMAEMAALVVGTDGSPDAKRHFRFAVEDGSVKIRLLVQTAFLASWSGAAAFAHDMAAFQRGQLDDISDSRRLVAARKIVASLKRDGATTVRMSSEYAKVGEFDAMKSSEAKADPALVDSEGFFTAEMVNVGGMSANAHFILEDGTEIVADSTREYLPGVASNLYKEVLVHVAYKVNVATGEKMDYRLLDVIVPSGEFDETAFDRDVSRPNGWDAVKDPVAYVREMRSANV